ncbi:MAG TPA: bifunctional homocysteine S-methyltransferase/methylenetetrahydrofolate reductase [Anaerolineales bacterium]|nr:bifunctional homocysteine S-methyltransferase/methylenetetrahydrofolate reductase [Anaerolineales bacterium]
MTNHSESTFLASLTQRTLLSDGATGTQLHERGFGLERCYELLNLTHPQVVQAIHRDYLQAGADILETHTFGANALRLAQHSLQEQVHAINTAAVQNARTAIASFPTTRKIWVAGSVGPLGVAFAPLGRTTPEQAYQAFYQQISALVAAGVDVIWLETFGDLREIEQAVLAARQFPHLPLTASLSFAQDDHTSAGDHPAKVARTLHQWGVDIIGLNCSVGPSQLTRLLRRMVAAVPTARFAVLPNAGWPEQVGGRIFYAAGAGYFADYAKTLLEGGACIVGGCCGTTPNHIAAMRPVVSAFGAPIVHNPSSELEEASESEAPAKVLPPSQWAQALQGEEPFFTVEVHPPKGWDCTRVIEQVNLLAKAGSDFVNIADSPLARMRMSPLALCQLVQQEVGLETVLHFPTRGRNLLRVQGDLLAAHALGIRNIFAVMGDPSAIGDYPSASDNFDVPPTGLLKLIKENFNCGVDQGGQSIGSPTAFTAGCALSLTPADYEREAKLLKTKLAHGADFALTQPVFEPQAAFDFIEKFQSENGDWKLPLVIGILPLYNLNHANFLHHEVPGIHLPAQILTRMAETKHPAETGIAIAVELIAQLRHHPAVRGFYLMPPFGRYHLAVEMIRQVKSAY